VKFNMGTLRRWSTGTSRALEIVRSGEIGGLRSLTSYSVGNLLHSASHFIDLLLLFAADATPDWVQGTILNEDCDPSLERYERDMSGTGIICFPGGVFGYLMSTPRWAQFEIICERGSLRTRNDSMDWELEIATKRGRTTEYAPSAFPAVARESSTVRLIRDLLHALETGEPTRQGVRTAALGLEIAFGVLESHRQGGARVEIPLENRSLWMHTH
jgi:predicted dehydrogenase